MIRYFWKIKIIKSLTIEHIVENISKFDIIYSIYYRLINLENIFYSHFLLEKNGLSSLVIDKLIIFQILKEKITKQI